MSIRFCGYLLLTQLESIVTLGDLTRSSWTPKFPSTIIKIAELSTSWQWTEDSINKDSCLRVPTDLIYLPLTATEDSGLGSATERSLGVCGFKWTKIKLTDHSPSPLLFSLWALFTGYISWCCSIQSMNNSTLNFDKREKESLFYNGSRKAATIGCP